MAATLLYVTQVAPYVDGPAGAHGVLTQSITAMAQMADLCGLELAPVDDVRTIDEGDIEHAGLLALFTIGETPWSPGQRLAIVERLRAGRLAVFWMISCVSISSAPPPPRPSAPDRPR